MKKGPLPSMVSLAGHKNPPILPGETPKQDIRFGLFGLSGASRESHRFLRLFQFERALSDYSFRQPNCCGVPHRLTVFYEQIPCLRDDEDADLMAGMFRNRFNYNNL
jgi:hypothetical protein